MVAAFGAGIWAGRCLDINGVFAAVLAVCFLMVAAGRRGSVVMKGAALVLLWFFAGLLRMDCAGQVEKGAIAGYVGQTVAVHGKIAGTPSVLADAGGKWTVRYTVELDRIGIPGETERFQAVTGGVFLSSTQNSPQAKGGNGDEVDAAGKVRLIHSFHNPGQPDWAEILAGRGIAARVAALPGTLRITARETALSRLSRWRSRVRSDFLSAMPEGDAALITGMLFGGYEGIDRQTVREFGMTGIVHILSVSGAHMALVAAAIFWLTRRLSLSQAWSALFAAMAVLFYGFISGFSPPVIRSVGMGLLAMAAIASNRISYAPHALSLAILAMLAWEPRSLFDISYNY